MNVITILVDRTLFNSWFAAMIQDHRHVGNMLYKIADDIHLGKVYVDLKMPTELVQKVDALDAAVKLMRTRIRLLAQPKSMRSIIDATQREQRYGLA